jgi:hypothetical protein
VNDEIKSADAGIQRLVDGLSARQIGDKVNLMVVRCD